MPSVSGLSQGEPIECGRVMKRRMLARSGCEIHEAMRSGDKPRKERHRDLSDPMGGGPKSEKVFGAEVPGASRRAGLFLCPSAPMPLAVQRVLGVAYLQLAFRLGQIGKVSPAQNAHHLFLGLFPDGVRGTEFVTAALTLGQ